MESRDEDEREPEGEYAQGPEAGEAEPGEDELGEPSSEDDEDGEASSDDQKNGGGRPGPEPEPGVTAPMHEVTEEEKRIAPMAMFPGAGDESDLPGDDEDEAEEQDEAEEDEDEAEEDEGDGSGEDEGSSERDPG